MKRTVLFLAAAASVGLAQQAQSVIGSIGGALLGDDGSSIIGATIRLHLTPALSQSRTFLQQTDWEGTSGSAGSFQFIGLPEGNYTLCARVATGTWLNPCEWNLTVPAATVSAANPNTGISITLHRGAAVPVRVDDAGQVLSQNEGKTPGAGLLLMISGPGPLLRVLPVASQDSGGRNYQVVVPFNTALTLVVGSSFYHVTGPSGIAISRGISTQFPLFVGVGQQVATIKFALTGAGH